MEFVKNSLLFDIIIFIKCLTIINFEIILNKFNNDFIKRIVLLIKLSYK